jgi:hypothetical protein
MLRQIGFDTPKTTALPMEPGLKLGKSINVVSEKEKYYRSVVGSL